jgi:hypothetical protein
LNTEEKSGATAGFVALSTPLRAIQPKSPGFRCCVLRERNECEHFNEASTGTSRGETLIRHENAAVGVLPFQSRGVRVVQNVEEV